MLERLLEKALEEGAAFANVARTSGREMIICCDDRSAQILMQLCRQYKIDARMLRPGIKAALSQYMRRRWTLIPALIIAAVLLMLFFSRIWIIDVVFIGENVPAAGAASIRAFLEESGVVPGMVSSRIDAGALEKELMAHMGNYSFIGLRLQGVRLLAEASPELSSPEIYDIALARDLVAERDGVIESIEVYSGTACVSAGDIVRRGQLLIRGEEQKSAEETAAVNALGNVYARCWFSGSANAAVKQTILSHTGNVRSERTLSLFSLKIPLTRCETFESEEIQQRSIPLVGLYLPAEIIETQHFETAKTEISRDENQLLAELETLARADALARIDIPSGQFDIRESWLETDINEHTAGVRAVYEISTDIAASRDALAKEDY